MDNKFTPDSSEEQSDVASSESEISDTRAFVLGLDGVPWGMLKRWASEGELPAFAKVMEEGASGPLASTTPATTPLAWPSIATGTWPDKHGIYWFQRLSPDVTHRMNTSDDVRQPALWELLSPSLVGNVPMTYPASDIDGIMVAGMMSPKVNDRWASPADFARRVEERIPNYRIGLDWQEYADQSEEFQADLGELVAARRELMRLMMEEEDDWRLFFFVYTAPDRLQHLVWDEPVLLEHYRTLDDILAEIIGYVDERDANLFIVSDHGFGPIDRLVSLPWVLEQAGYLRRRESSGSRGRLAKLGLTKDNVQSWLDTVGIDDRTMVDYLPQAFVDMVALQIPGDHTLYDVDHSQTQAIVHGPGNVYVNDSERFTNGCVDPDDVPQVKRELVDVFENVTDPETGEPVLVVHDGDELFPSDDDSPDLVVKGREGYEVLTRLTDEPIKEADVKAAGHRSEGIYLAYGPSIEAGSHPSEATVVDVAPTLLQTLGEAVPAEMDGRVLTEIFEPGSSPAERPVVRSAPGAVNEPTETSDEAVDEESFEDVEDRLRGLGYID